MWTNARKLTPVSGIGFLLDFESQADQAIKLHKRSGAVRSTEFLCPEPGGYSLRHDP